MFRAAIVGLLSFFLFQNPLFAKGSNQYLAISQGVSSPSSTSTINFTNGFTSENPVGVIYQESFRLTGQVVSGTTESFGGELGIGNGKYGFAVGYFDTNNGRTVGAVAGVLGGIGIGLGFDDDLSTLGLLFNPTGGSRVGVVASLNNPAGDNNNITSLGLGYSYIGSQFVFSLDASKRIYEDETAKDDTLLVTPGISLLFSQLSLSLSYNVFLDLPSASNTTNDLWWGLGFNGGNSWNLALYGDYVGDISVAASFYF